MKTTTVTIRIRLDQALEIEERGLNLSEFTRSKLDEEFGSNDFLSAKEKELKDRLKRIKQAKKGLKKAKKEKDSGEKDFINAAKIKIKNAIESEVEVIEQCRIYNMRFNKRIHPMKFRELVQ